MGTNNSVQQVDIGIQTIVMAIREELMSYFKGTCVQRLTTGSNVRMSTVGEHMENYQYVRRQAQNEQAQILWVGTAPILTVKQAPDRIIFHLTVLNRSPQMREINKGVQKFIEQFLIGIEKEYENAPK